MKETEYNKKEILDVNINQKNINTNNKNKEYEIDTYDDMNYYIDDEIIDYINSINIDDFYSDCDYNYDYYDYCDRYDEADEI